MIKNNAKKGTKTYRLIAIYNWLQMGETIVVNNCRIWLHYNVEENKHYIHWESYGTSATEMSLKDLRWILTKIANSTTFEWTTESDMG